MKPRTMIILAVITVALIVITMSSQRSERSRETLAAGPIFPELEADAVTGIKMTAEDKEVHLIKQDGEWLVASEGDYPADPTAVDRILEKLPSFDLRHLRSQNAAQQKTFEVDDSSGTEVLMLRDGGHTLAHFRVGKNGPDFRSQYIRPVGTDQVYQIPQYLKSVFDVGRATWRNKEIFKLDREKIARILIEPEEDAAITLVKDDAGTFTMTVPESAAVKTNQIQSLLGTLSNLRCDDFPEPDSIPSLADAGLLPPRQRIEIQMEDGAVEALGIGNEVGDVRNYVKKDGNDTIFLLSKGRVGSLIRKAADLKEEPAAEASPEG